MNSLWLTEREEKLNGEGKGEKCERGKSVKGGKG